MNMIRTIILPSKLDDDESTASNVKKSVSGFLNHVAEVFTPPPDDGDQEAIVIRNQQPVILNRLQVSVMRCDIDGTYELVLFYGKVMYCFVICRNSSLCIASLFVVSLLFLPKFCGS